MSTELLIQKKDALAVLKADLPPRLPITVFFLLLLLVRIFSAYFEISGLPFVLVQKEELAGERLLDAEFVV